LYWVTSISDERKKKRQKRKSGEKGDDHSLFLLTILLLPHLKCISLLIIIEVPFQVPHKFHFKKKFKKIWILKVNYDENLNDMN